MNLKEQSVAVVGGDREMLRISQEYFRRFGCREITIFEEPSKASKALQDGASVGLWVVDTTLPEGRGLAFIQEIAAATEKRTPRVLVIPVVEQPGADLVSALVKSGVLAFLAKPFSEMDLHWRIREINAFLGETSASPAFTLQVHSLLVRGWYAEAQQLLEAELEKHPNVARYHVLLLRVLIELAQDERADEMARKLIPKAEHYAPLMLVMAVLQVKRKNHAGAISFLERSLLFAPLAVEGMLLSAESFLAQGRLSEAERCLSEAEARVGRCEVVKAGLVRVWAAQGRCEDARKLQAELEDPSEPYQSCMVRGVVLAQLGLHEESIAMYERAMPFLLEAGKQFALHYNIALGYFRVKNYEKSREFLKKGLALSPASERAKQLLAKVDAAEAQGGPAGASACQPCPGLVLSGEQRDFLLSSRFVRPSGLPLQLDFIDIPHGEKGNEAEVEQDLTPSKKPPVLSYDSGSLKRSRNIYRGDVKR